MKEIQEHLKVQVSKPPPSSSTRWGGVIPQFKWIGANRAALKRYNKDFPLGCAVNEDGSTFKDHSMSYDEVDICFQLGVVLGCCLEDLATMEAITRPTISNVMRRSLGLC